MSKRIFWIFAVAMTAFALSLSAVAQPPGGPGGGGPRGPGGGPGGPGGGPGGPGGGMMMGGPGGGIGQLGQLIQNPEFAKLLELTPQQTTDLQRVTSEAGEAIRTKTQEAMRPQQDGGPPSPEAMRQNMDKIRQLVEEGIDEASAKLDQVLQPAQRTKFRETTFQTLGGLDSPMLNDRMLAVVDLTDAQKEQIRKITEERNAAMMADIQNINWRDREAMERSRVATEERNKKFADQIKALLTPEQKAKAEKLTAEAPALREKLGIPAPGPRGQQGPGQRGGQPPAPGGGFVPGSNAWRPGQDTPGAPPAAPPGGRQRGGFPRGEN